MIRPELISRLRVAPGKYELFVQDVATGVLLAHARDAIEVRPGARVASDLALRCVRTRVTLRPAPKEAMLAHELRVEAPPGIARPWLTFRTTPLEPHRIRIDRSAPAA